MALRRIILLDVIPNTRPVQVRVALRLGVPAALQPSYANPNAATITPDLTTDAELSALRAGQIVEQLATLTLPAGSDLAALKASATAAWQTAQATLVQAAPGAAYGVVWDGTAWSA